MFGVWQVAGMLLFSLLPSGSWCTSHEAQELNQTITNFSLIPQGGANVFHSWAPTAPRLIEVLINTSVIILITLGSDCS